MANRRFAPARAVAKRSRLWFGWNTGRIVVAPAGNNMQVIIGSASLLVMGKPTIARIRGYLRVQMDGTGAINSQSQWAFGITTLQDQATTQFPFPIGNEDEPWLFFASGHLTQPSASLGTESGESAGITMVVDSKAMRIVRPGYNVIAVMSNIALLGASPQIEYSAAGRALIMPS